MMMETGDDNNDEYPDSDDINDEEISSNDEEIS
jgi:hypothetical protein